MQFDQVYKAAMTKSATLRKAAGPYSDLVLGQVSDLAANAVLPGVGGLAAPIGAIHGLVSDTPTEEQEAEMDQNRFLSFVPGVASSRFFRRLKRQNQDDTGSQRHTVAQYVGPLTSTLATTGVGAALGTTVGGFLGGGRGAVFGGSLGAGIGAGAAATSYLVAALAALINRTRTRQEQREYANSSTAPEYLAPGLSFYNNLKSYGRSHADSVERDEQAKAKQTTKIASYKQRRHVTAQDLLAEVAAVGLHRY